MASADGDSRHPGVVAPWLPESGEITRWLEGVQRGEEGALERLVPLLYDELRRLARERLRGERAAHTLTPTALVHEAYFRLVEQRRLPAASRLDFLAAASKTMFRVLVDHARSRRRQKRGGAAEPLPLDEMAPLLTPRASEEVLALEEALGRLAAREERVARIVELKFFGGLSFDEIATLLAVSERTVQRDWQTARAWLRRELSTSGPVWEGASP